MRNKIILVFALIYSAISFSQTGEIKVKLTDKKTKETIPFATVAVYTGSVIAGKGTSNIDGEAIIKSLKPGKYVVQANYMGYTRINTAGVIVTADKTTLVNMEMSVATVELKCLEVMTSSKPRIEADTKSGSIVTREEYSRKSSASASKVLRGRVAESESVADEIAYMPEIMAKEKEGAAAPAGMGGGRAGILTAGQLNDFSKWDIWKDVSTNELGKNNEQWKIRPLERYSVQITTTERRPVIDARVELSNSAGESLWVARTDNTGKAELWQDIYKEKSTTDNLTVKISYKGKSYTMENPKSFAKGINMLQIKTACDVPQKADVVFVVDATGSMGDEIEYLKMELNDIIGKVKKKNDIEINLGSVFYRDQGDEYLTKKSDLSKDENKTIDFIKEQRAGGGGDFPEAVHSALDVAVNQMEWSDNAVARLMFLVLDAPPHNNPEVIASVQRSIKLAAEKGIRVIPIASSGVDKSTEYLMRAFALATNGTYVFLTDHSGVGNAHIKPSTDKYDVELLNDVLLRLFNEYFYTTPCDERPTVSTKKDTSWVFNQQIIDRVTADTTLLKKYSQVRTVRDTLKMMLTDTSVTLKKDFYSFKYYPNPTTGILNVEIEGKATEIFISDISGKIVMRHEVPAMDKIEIDLSSLSKGTYFVMYQQGDKWCKGKVILI